MGLGSGPTDAPSEVIAEESQSSRAAGRFKIENQPLKFERIVAFSSLICPGLVMRTSKRQMSRKHFQVPHALDSVLDPLICLPAVSNLTVCPPN